MVLLFLFPLLICIALIVVGIVLLRKSKSNVHKATVLATVVEIKEATYSGIPRRLPVYKYEYNEKAYKFCDYNAGNSTGVCLKKIGDTKYIDINTLNPTQRAYDNTGFIKIAAWTLIGVGAFILLIFTFIILVAIAGTAGAQY